MGNLGDGTLSLLLKAVEQVVEQAVEFPRIQKAVECRQVQTVECR